MTTTQYAPGDTILVDRGPEGEVAVKVKYREADIKNGVPGWEGKIVGDDSIFGGVWGYDTQIIRVLSKAGA